VDALVAAIADVIRARIVVVAVRVVETAVGYRRVDAFIGSANAGLAFVRWSALRAVLAATGDRRRDAFIRDARIDRTSGSIVALRTENAAPRDVGVGTSTVRKAEVDRARVIVVALRVV